MSTLNEKTNHYPAGWEAAEETRKGNAATAQSAAAGSAFTAWTTAGGQYDRFALETSSFPRVGDRIVDVGDQGTYVQT